MKSKKRKPTRSKFIVSGVPATYWSKASIRVILPSMDQASIQAPAKKSPTCAKRYSQHEREEILKDFHKSGLSPYRYCLDKTVTRDTLIKWLGVSPTKKQKNVGSTDGFFKIQMNGSAQSPMIIRLPYDCSIEIYHPNQIQWALDLVQAYAQASC